MFSNQTHHFVTRNRRTVAGLGRLMAIFPLLVTGAAAPSAENWPEWRGPRRDGRSLETGLPAKWSPQGENLAWRVPIGSRSSPVAFRDRLYLYTSSGTEEVRQERLVALDAATGKTLWERKVSLFHTDVPPHRVAWASPSVDSKTGNIYTLSGGATLMAFAPDGKVSWERGLVEDFGAITTHGGRTTSPIIDGDLVVVNELISAWGTLARGGNRYFAFDKKTGEAVWISSPQQRHYDTNYSTPIVTTVNGVRLLIVGGTDGVFHALKMATGEPVWRFEVSKRAINNSPVMHGQTVIVSHSEENIGTSEMGLLAAFDAGLKGEVTKAQLKWATPGFQGGFPTPVLDEKEGCIYTVDNGAVLAAFDVATGKKLWDRNLGTIQKGSPVLADGKLYVGTENGKVYVVKPSKGGVEVLDEDVLGTDQAPEPIVASPIVSGGRIYVSSMEATYAIGPKALTASREATAPASAAPQGAAGAPAAVRIVPADVNVKPGQAQKFRVDVFDANGNQLTGAPKATFALQGLKGTVGPDGAFTPDPNAGAQSGLLQATVGTSQGAARIRVLPPLPLVEDFEKSQGEAPPAHWINATGKFDVKDFEGSKVLQRREDNTLTRRARVFFDSQDLADYTVEMDVRTIERRRQQGDVGVIAQRYIFVLFGNSQRVELQPWQPAVKMTVSAPLAWKADRWYRVKLEVQNLKGGTTRARAKAWPRGETEPTGWLVEKIDKIGHKRGSPGLYADAPWGAYYDNVRVYPNEGQASSSK
jgi:outer membrane protein assembly factor BamB